MSTETNPDALPSFGYPHWAGAPAHAIGVDMIEIDRVRDVLTKHPERFLQRVFTTEEIAFCRGRIPELAARFAAKEATMKALGTGARSVAWRDIEVLPDRRGKPILFLHGGGAARAASIGLEAVDVTLSHLASFAIAVVVGTQHVREQEPTEARERLVRWMRERGRLP